MIDGGLLNRLRDMLLLAANNWGEVRDSSRGDSMASRIEAAVPNERSGRMKVRSGRLSDGDWLDYFTGDVWCVLRGLRGDWYYMIVSRSGNRR